MFEYLVTVDGVVLDRFGDMNLLEEVCHQWLVLQFQKTHAISSVSFYLLLLDDDVSSQLVLSPCICSAVMASNPLKKKTLPQIKHFPYKFSLL